MEYKLACYMDDIVLSLEQLTNSLHKLMKTFYIFGQLSVYKMNIGKTKWLENYGPEDVFHPHTGKLSWQ